MGARPCGIGRGAECHILLPSGVCRVGCPVHVRSEGNRDEESLVFLRSQTLNPAHGLTRTYAVHHTSPCEGGEGVAAPRQLPPSCETKPSILLTTTDRIFVVRNTPPPLVATASSLTQLFPTLPHYPLRSATAVCQLPLSARRAQPLQPFQAPTSKTPSTYRVPTRVPPFWSFSDAHPTMAPTTSLAILIGTAAAVMGQSGTLNNTGGCLSTSQPIPFIS